MPTVARAAHGKKSGKVNDGGLAALCCPLPAATVPCPSLLSPTVPVVPCSPLLSPAVPCPSLLSPTVPYCPRYPLPAAASSCLSLLSPAVPCPSLPSLAIVPAHRCCPLSVAVVPCCPLPAAARGHPVSQPGSQPLPRASLAPKEYLQAARVPEAERCL